MSDAKHCGYIALLGRPNVGKSTILNYVLRQKIAITSRKPQTTRHNLLGVDTEGDYQAIYVDTPGIHSDVNKALNRYMVGEAKRVIDDVDVRVLVADAERWRDEDQKVAELLLKHKGGRNVAVLNKIDLVSPKEKLLPLMARLSDMGFSDVVPISALRDEGIAEFRQLIFSALPAGQHLFAEDQITDQTTRSLAAEIIREKLMRQLGDEIPHSTAVMILKYEERPDLVEIHAEIYVERNGQKRIVVGTEGQRLKLIGQEARQDIERLVDCKVMLHLWVKVRKGWTNSAGLLRQLGYD
ncbi:MAG: GTPase Era [Pseudomonadales bacterium]